VLSSLQLRSAHPLRLVQSTRENVKILEHRTTHWCRTRYHHTLHDEFTATAEWRDDGALGLVQDTQPYDRTFRSYSPRFWRVPEIASPRGYSSFVLIE
jgi:hypothetical protein